MRRRVFWSILTFMADDADKEDLYDEGLDLAFDGNYREAINKYRAALEIDPEFADAIHGVAMAHAELEELDEAIEAAKKVLPSGNQVQDFHFLTTSDHFFKLLSASTTAYYTTQSFFFSSLFLNFVSF